MTSLLGIPVNPKSTRQLNQLQLFFFLISGSEEQNQTLVWACVQPNSPELVSQLSADSMPRVKLTGTGKMPVVDMRKSLLNPTHPNVSGLPPKSPVYAAVNKVKKLTSPVKKAQPTHQHNYCNVSPLLGDVINKSADLFATVKPHQIFSSLEPVNSVVYENTKQVLSRLEQSHEEIDPINLRLRELHDALDEGLTNPGDLDLPPPPPELLAEPNCAKYLSNENLPPRESQDVKTSSIAKNGSVTMPRSKPGSTSVIMRRSSSVPCKVPTSQSDRGSTSSSDSGFSAGSPGHSSSLQCMAMK